MLTIRVFYRKALGMLPQEVPAGTFHVETVPPRGQVLTPVTSFGGTLWVVEMTTASATLGIDYDIVVVPYAPSTFISNQ